VKGRKLLVICTDGTCRFATAEAVARVWRYEALVCLGEKWLEGCWGVVEAVPPFQEREGLLVLSGVLVRLSREFVTVEGPATIELEVPCKGVVRLEAPARFRVYVWAGTYTVRILTGDGSVWHLVLSRDSAYAYRVVGGTAAAEASPVQAG